MKGSESQAATQPWDPMAGNSQQINHFKTDKLGFSKLSELHLLHTTRAG